MKPGKEIERIRCECGLSVVDMCNVMNMTESDYRALIIGMYTLSVFQCICLICCTRRPLDSLL